MVFLAENTSKFKTEDFTIDQSSGLIDSPNTFNRVIIDPANPAVSVPGGGFSAQGDLFSIMPQSLNPFNENPSSFSPSRTLPEDKRSGDIIHHYVMSSEKQSVVRLQMDSEIPQTSTTQSPQDHSVTPYFLSILPGEDFSTTNSSKTNRGKTLQSPQNQTDSKIQVGLSILPRPDNVDKGRTEGRKQDHNSIFFDFKGVTLSLPLNSQPSSPGTPGEGSGSGSGLYNNRLNQELDGATTVKTDLSSIQNSTVSLMDKTRKKSGSTVTGMDSDTDWAGSKISSEKKYETVAEKQMEDDESDLSGEQTEETEGERVLYTGNQTVWKVDGETDESAIQFNSTAGRDMLKEKERDTEVETAVGEIIHTEPGSGGETESNVGEFSQPEDIHGSGEAESGDTGDGGEDSITEVVFGRKDDLHLSISQKPTAEPPQFDNSEENGDSDEHDEERTNLSLDAHDVLGNLTLEHIEQESDGKRIGGLEGEEHNKGGDKESSNEAVTGESLQQFSDVDGLLFDAAGSPVLGRLVPLLKLTDGSEATGKQTEGKCSSTLSLSSALPLCDTM